MAQELDFVERAAKAKGFDICPRTIFVEGTTDVDLFQLAARLERERSSIDLLDNKLAIVAAGEREKGGVYGVCRELVTFKNLAGVCLLPNGRPKYRFVGLFDNDAAGINAIRDIRRIHTDALEYKDVFRLHPIMPLSSNRDPSALRRRFELDNEQYRGITWELEDLLSETLIECFIEDNPYAIRKSFQVHDKIHYDWTDDGKAKLHRFTKKYAMHSDVQAVVNVLQAMWYYFGMTLPSSS